MREFKIIVPAHDDHKLAEFEVQLIAAHGGFTRVIGAGAWRNGESHDERETVWVYTIASDARATAVRLLAKWAAQHFDQTCVYVRYHDSEVEFVSP